MGTLRRFASQNRGCLDNGRDRQDGPSFGVLKAGAASEFPLSRRGEHCKNFNPKRRSSILSSSCARSLRRLTMIRPIRPFCYASRRCFFWRSSCRPGAVQGQHAGHHHGCQGRRGGRRQGHDCQSRDRRKPGHGERRGGLLSNRLFLRGSTPSRLKRPASRSR